MSVELEYVLECYRQWATRISSFERRELVKNSLHPTEVQRYVNVLQTFRTKISILIDMWWYAAIEEQQLRKLEFLRFHFSFQHFTSKPFTGTSTITILHNLRNLRTVFFMPLNGFEVKHNVGKYLQIHVPSYSPSAANKRSYVPVRAHWRRQPVRFYMKLWSRRAKLAIWRKLKEWKN